MEALKWNGILNEERSWRSAAISFSVTRCSMDAVPMKKWQPRGPSERVTWLIDLTASRSW